MNLEQVKALKINGLSDEDAQKIADASEKELTGYVEKSKYDEVNAAKEKAEKDIKDRDKQLETLKGQVGDNEDLKDQIEKLQKENKDNKANYDKEIQDLKISNAIKLAINGTAQDADLVAGLIDKTKLIVGTDGKIVGLDEQVKTLQETKSFLFKPQEEPGADGKPFVKGTTGGAEPPTDAPKTLKDSIAAALGTK